MKREFSVVKIKSETGKRYCVVKNSTNGVPLYYPNIYLSTMDHKGRSFNTILRTSYIIIIFEQFLSENGIDLAFRLKEKKFLTYTEIHSLSVFLRKRRKAKKVIKINDSLSMNEENQCYRLTAIRDYIAWLYSAFYGDDLLETNELISEFTKIIKKHKPVISSGNYINKREVFKSLEVEQTLELFDLLRINNKLNPFSMNVRKRNLLMISILNETGIRGGELLNLRLDDFIKEKRYLKITKRSNDTSDHRLHRPMVKTLPRDIPISSMLIEMICEYIEDRKFYKGSKEHDYLFITHKSGPSEGLPLSINGYHKVMSTIKNSKALSQSFEHFTGHSLRHTWNHRYNEKFKGVTNDFKITELEQIRCIRMGWKLNSKSVLTYNRRYIYNKAMEAFDYADLTKGILAKKVEVKNESVDEYRKLLGIKSKR